VASRAAVVASRRPCGYDLLAACGGVSRSSRMVRAMFFTLKVGQFQAKPSSQTGLAPNA
jgi:hypothetical protein